MIVVGSRPVLEFKLSGPCGRPVLEFKLSGPCGGSSGGEVEIVGDMEFVALFGLSCCNSTGLTGLPLLNPDFGFILDEVVVFCSGFSGF